MFCNACHEYGTNVITQALECLVTWCTRCI